MFLQVTVGLLVLGLIMWFLHRKIVVFYGVDLRTEKDLKDAKSAIFSCDKHKMYILIKYTDSSLYKRLRSYSRHKNVDYIETDSIQLPYYRLFEEALKKEYGRTRVVFLVQGSILFMNTIKEELGFFSNNLAGMTNYPLLAYERRFTLNGSVTTVRNLRKYGKYVTITGFFTDLLSCCKVARRHTCSTV